MNQKERDQLMHDAKYGNEDVAEAARAIFKLTADIQNNKEAKLPLDRLRTKILNEGGGRKLSVSELSARTPHVAQKDDCTVEVYEWWDMVSRYTQRHFTTPQPCLGARPVYTGPLASFWTTTLQGRTT